MQLLQAVIHEFVKESAREVESPAPPSYIKADEQLDVTLTPTIRLIEDIKSLYGKKGNYSSQGTFKLDTTANTFPREFDTFLDSPGDDDAFLELTINTMDNLVEESKKENFATGGYIVFAHYISLEQNFFLVAMVKKKDGITLVNLKPETIQEVDLSKLHQAIKINNSSYVGAMEKINSGDPFEGSYLSFISPSERGASSYFVSTFGCEDAIPAKQATKAAFQAVRYYFDSVEKLQPLKSEAITAVAELFQERLSNDEEDRICTLEMINEKVQSVINYNGLTDIENNFIDVANSEDFNVPASFYPNKSAVTEETRVKLEGVGGAWKLNFEKRVFGASAASDIQYVNDTENDEPYIIIRHLDEKLVSKLEQALDDEPSS